MNILFVQPGLKEINNQYPPVGICYLASKTRDQGYTVDIYDAAAIGGSLSAALDVVEKSDPDVLCLSIYTIGLIEQFWFLKRAKEKHPDCVVVVGGPHATSLPLHTMEECATIDFLVFGEGEHTLVDLLNTIREKADLSAVAGICYRNREEIIQNEPRQMIDNIDELSFPAYDLIVKNGFQYARRSFNLTNKIGVIMSSRGCPFHCAFCFKATFGNRLRRRSPENVVAEIQWQIDQFGVTEFQFVDDLFAVNSKWLNEFFQELENQSVKVPWKCLSRVDSVKKADLVKMYQHGCYGIEFGVESGNNEILTTASKGITTSQIREAFKIAKEVGFLTFGFFIFGLENDSHQTIRQTCDFAIEITPDLCGFAVLMPFPGTRLYEKLPHDLRFKWSIFNSYYDKNALPLSLCEVSPTDLRQYARQADAEVSGSFSYLFKNVLFRKGGYTALRKEAFNKWFHSLVRLVSRRIKGKRVFGNENFVANILVIARDMAVLSIVGIFFVIPNKILRWFKNYSS